MLPVKNSIPNKIRCRGCGELQPEIVIKINNFNDNEEMISGYGCIRSANIKVT